MEKVMELYTVISETGSGFWINLPVFTGQTVLRDEWLRLHRADPYHFQMITFASNDDLPRQSMSTYEVVIERALRVTWSDEVSQ